MKTDTHPEYNAIVFRDLASGATFLTRSTATSDKTIELDGVTYPVIDVEISSASSAGFSSSSRVIASWSARPESSSIVLAATKRAETRGRIS